MSQAVVYNLFRICDLEEIIMKSLKSPRKIGENISLLTFIDDDDKNTNILLHCLIYNTKLPKIIKLELKKIFNNKTLLSTINKCNVSHSTYTMDKISQIVNAFVYLTYNGKLGVFKNNFKEYFKIVNRISLHELVKNLKKFNNDEQNRIVIFSKDIWKCLDTFGKKKFTPEESDKEAGYVVSVITACLFAALYVDLDILDNFGSSKKYTDPEILCMLREFNFSKIIKEDLKDIDTFIKYEEDGKKPEKYDYNIKFSDHITWDLEIILRRITQISLGVYLYDDLQHSLALNYDGDKTILNKVKISQYNALLTFINYLGIDNENKFLKSDDLKYLNNLLINLDKNNFSSEENQKLFKTINNIIKLYSAQDEDIINVIDNIITMALNKPNDQLIIDLKRTLANKKTNAEIRSFNSGIRLENMSEFDQMENAMLEDLMQRNTKHLKFNFLETIEIEEE